MTTRTILVGQLRADFALRDKSTENWRTSTLNLCVHLAQARTTFSNDRDFGAWLKQNDLDALNDHDRAAAIAMGQQPKAAKTVLEKTERRSLQLIHREEFSTFANASKHTDAEATTPPKKDGTARKKHGRKPKKEHRNDDITPEVEEQLAKAVLDDGKSLKETAEAFGGISEQVVKVAVAKERGKREARSDPPIDVSTLPKSAQEKLEAAKRQWLREWEREKRELIRVAAVKLVEELLLPHYKEKFERAERFEKLLSKRKGLMTEADYKTILRCLHPDNSASEKVRGEAFRLFNDLKDFLVIEVTPVGPTTFPNTFADVMAMRARKNGAADVKTA